MGPSILYNMGWDVQMQNSSCIGFQRQMFKDVFFFISLSFSEFLGTSLFCGFVLGCFVTIAITANLTTMDFPHRNGASGGLDLAAEVYDVGPRIPWEIWISWCLTGVDSSMYPTSNEPQLGNPYIYKPYIYI